MNRAAVLAAVESVLIEHDAAEGGISPRSRRMILAALDAALAQEGDQGKAVVPVEPDNHHNAVDCPYCLPDRTRVTSEAVREALDEAFSHIDLRATDVGDALRIVREIRDRRLSSQRSWGPAREELTAQGADLTGKWDNDA